MTIGTPMRGTRTSQNFKLERIAQGHLEESYTRDVGMSKRVSASVTFVGGGTNQLQAAAATFAAFAAGDDITVAGSNKNDGFFHVVSTDASTQLTVDPPPTAEGPLTVTVRTA